MTLLTDAIGTGSVVPEDASSPVPPTIAIPLAP
jgi:hypothetical protein